MRRLSPPGLPDDEPPPPTTEPRAGLGPPRRRPPTAVATRRRPEHPGFGASYHGRRLRGIERVPRAILAGLLLAAATAGGAAGMSLLPMLVLGIGGVLCAWAAATGEDAVRSLRRGGRLLRLRRFRARSRRVARDARRLPAA